MAKEQTPKSKKPRWPGLFKCKQAVLSLFGWNHVYHLVIFGAARSKSHVAVYQSKQGVVATNANIVACVELGATLAHDDGTGADEFAAKSLDAEHFGL